MSLDLHKSQAEVRQTKCLSPNPFCVFRQFWQIKFARLFESCSSSLDVTNQWMLILSIYFGRLRVSCFYFYCAQQRFCSVLPSYWHDLTFSHSSQRSPSPGPNHVTSSINSAPSSASAPPTTSAARTSCSLTPSLSSHFNENLIRHVQGWPAEHVEKQVCPTTILFVFVFFCDYNTIYFCNVQISQASRLREEAHTMGSICLSENCTELKNLRSLVRVCEIQATLREQRWAYAKHACKSKPVLK